MGSDYSQIFRWFANAADDEFVHLLSWIDKEKLRHDPEYGLKCFLTYAQGRQGTPNGYWVAWIKSVSQCYRDHLPLSEVGGLFDKFYSGKSNRQRNPIFDEDLAALHVPAVISDLEKGKLNEAFGKLIKLRGAGPKVVALFLRDAAVLLEAPEARWNPGDQYLACQPIDQWVGQVADALFGEPGSRAKHPFHQDAADSQRAGHLIEESLRARVSPLKVNQGIWFVCH